MACNNIPEDNKVFLNEMHAKVTKAKPEFETNAGTEAYPVPGHRWSQANIFNTAPTELTYHSHKDFSGRFEGLIPDKIVKDGSAIVLHQGMNPADRGGSKGAIIYYGYDRPLGPGARVLGWLLAWHTPLASDGEAFAWKVYGECGLIQKYIPEKIDWSVIESRLDNSQSNPDFTYFKDSESSAELSAKIIFPGNWSNIVASYNVQT